MAMSEDGRCRNLYMYRMYACNIIVDCGLVLQGGSYCAEGV